MIASKDEIMQVQKDGTTIVAMKYKGGVLLGADSRSSNVSFSIQTLRFHAEKMLI